MVTSRVINRKDLGRIANNLLVCLDKEIIPLLSSERTADRAFVVGETSNEHITFQLRPSDFDIGAYPTQHKAQLMPSDLGKGDYTRVYSISYRVPGGAPLEVKVDEGRGHSRVKVEGVTFTIPEYDPFNRDLSGKITQSKQLDSTHITKIRSELERLAKYQ